MGLFPGEIDFFKIFDRDALNITKAGSLFVALVENFNRIENLIDRDCRDALGKLFDEVKAPFSSLLTWKDIYEHREDTSDRCADMANVLEAIVLKYA